VDSIGGDGSLEEEELVSFMFPELDQENSGAADDLEARSNSDLGAATRFGTVNPML
jgi:hypothetical protein